MNINLIKVDSLVPTLYSYNIILLSSAFNDKIGIVASMNSMYCAKWTLKFSIVDHEKNTKGFHILRIRAIVQYLTLSHLQLLPICVVNISVARSSSEGKSITDC